MYDGSNAPSPFPVDEDGHGVTNDQRSVILDLVLGMATNGGLSYGI